MSSKTLGEEIASDLSQALLLIRKRRYSGARVPVARGVAIGAGDSFAAALALEAGTKGRVKAFDPQHFLSIASLEELASRREVLFALSVGGRTKEVIKAARSYVKAGGEVVGVTGSRESPLAKTSTTLILLDYSRTAMGVGAGRHLVMLARLAQALGEDPRIPTNIKEPCIKLDEPAVYTGFGDSYSTALYAALKSYEVFGASSRYAFLEQLVHAEIFSKEKTIYVFEPSSTKLDDRVKEVVNVLNDIGYSVAVVKRSSNNPWENMLGQQYFVLYCLSQRAIARRVEAPYYRLHRGVKQLAKLIYA